MCFTVISSVVTMVKYNASFPGEFNFSELPYILIGLAFTILVVVFFTSLRPQKRVGLVLPLSFVLANIIAVVLLLITDTRPVSDYKNIWETALLMADSEFDIKSLNYYDYMYIYNWQLGISCVESLFIRMFGSNFIALQIFNILLLNLTLLLTYLLGKRFLDKTVSSYCVLALATFFPVIITIPQFTNQHLACVLILAILLLMESDKFWKWLVAGALIAVLNSVRPMGIILVLAIICYCGIILIKVGKKKTIRILLCVFLPYIACTTIINTVFIKFNYADSAISSAKIPYFKFDKGLTGYNFPEVEKFNSIEEYNDWEKQKLIDRIKSRPLEVFGFMITKMIRYFGCFDYKVEMTFNHDNKIWNTPPIKNWVMFGWGQYIGLVIMALIGCIKNKKFNYCNPTFIFFIGITLVYIFIEAFTSYRYESYPVLIIMSALSLSYVPQISSIRNLKFVR